MSNLEKLQQFKLERQALKGIYPESFKKYGYKYKKIYEDLLCCIYEQTSEDSNFFYYEAFKKTKHGFYPSTSNWGVSAWTFRCSSIDEAKSLLFKKLEDVKLNKQFKQHCKEDSVIDLNSLFYKQEKIIREQYQFSSNRTKSMEEYSYTKGFINLLYKTSEKQWYIYHDMSLIKNKLKFDEIPIWLNYFSKL